MRKETKKLDLSRETVRQLENGILKKAIGGDTPPPPPPPYKKWDEYIRA